MRTFVSYGPVDVDAHYYAPRTALIDFAYHQLLGENPERGGHYVTVWAPRQTGKTWIMQQALIMKLSIPPPPTGVVVQPVFVTTGS